jgi:hypothetical protein
MPEIEVSKRLRIFAANWLIALGWTLKGCCKPCAHWLFTTARWLVPEVQRFFIQCKGSNTRNRRLFEWLLNRVQPRVVGLLIVLAFMGLLDLAMRNTATETQPEHSAFLQEPQSKVLSVGKSSEAMEAFVSETSSISELQIAPVPLPLRKPERVDKVPKRAKLAATQRSMAQKKRAAQKPLRQ